MKVEIVEKVENPLLKRAEVKFKVDHSGGPTPKRLEVRAQLASLLGISEELLVIDKLASTHGQQIASGIARTYSSREQLAGLERMYLLKRGLPKEAKPEKPAEEKPKEAKAEKAEKPPKEKAEEKPKPEKAEQPREAKPEEKTKVKETPQKGGSEGGKGS